MRLFAIVVLAAACLGAGPATAETVPVGRFSAGTLEGWESRAFNGETAYALVDEPGAASTVLRAEAKGSASGYFRKIEVDLSRTPYLNWSWKVERTFPGIDEDERAGDDYPARIYVVVERGILGLTSFSLNYVWASQHPEGSVWSSPYSSRVQLMALDSGSEQLGQWRSHKRDLRADLHRTFGEDIAVIDAVALMTDADDSANEAISYYGDIWLSAE
jgi:hypothetical protein